MDVNDAEWITDIYKLYGSCATNFLKSDGTSSIENLDPTSDVEDGNMLPRSPRERRSVNKVSSARRRYYDSKLPGNGMLTRCWRRTGSVKFVRRTLSSFFCQRDGDMLPGLPENVITVSIIFVHVNANLLNWLLGRNLHSALSSVYR
jgi:hypothetical protein